MSPGAKTFMYKSRTLAVSALLLSAPLFVFAHESENEVHISMTDVGFEPQSVEIKAGDTVTFENVGEKPHWPASNIHPTHSVYPGSDISKCGTLEAQNVFDACRAIPAGQSYAFTFQTPGNWRFHDHLSEFLGGSVTVLAGTTSTSTVTPSHRSLNGVVETIKVYLTKVFFSACPLCGEREKQSIDLWKITNEKDDQRTIFWVRVFGSDEFMKELVLDSPTVEFYGEPYESCHRNAHKAGRIAYEFYGDSLFRQQMDLHCQRGFSHGAMGAYLQKVATDDFVKTFDKNCLLNADPALHAQCEHELGHGVMLYNNYDLPKALQECERLSDRGSKRQCFFGVYMENIFTLLDPSEEGHVSQWADAARQNFPCDADVVTGDVDRAAICYQIQPYLWASPTTRSAYNTERVLAGCRAAPEAYKKSCYRGIGYSVTSTPSVSNNEELIAVCRSTSDIEHQRSCVLGATLARYIHWGLAYDAEQNALCALLEPERVDVCRREIDEQLANKE